MGTMLYPIILPLVAGIVCLLAPKGLQLMRAIFALLVAILTFISTILLFAAKPPIGVAITAYQGWLRVDTLSAFILLAVGFFGVIIALYSISFMKGKQRQNEYYAYTIWTIGASCGAVLSNNLILFLIFWGFLAITLYLLIGIAGPEASPAAKKTFIIVGGADALMLLGIAILWKLTGNLNIDSISVPIAGRLSAVAFLCLLSGAIAKAGAMPLHTWIPDTAEKAPTSVTAFLPASLDKLLGIYFLARICMNLFVLNKPMQTLLLFIGALTVVAAVMMAMIQHDLKRLLGYHAVSQVGYMVLGIATGNPIGIAGGLFHMLNNALYKCCLFLTGANVEHKTGTADLDKLGGLARFMPITFICCAIASLSISGVPPFNGFVSKWLVYQGLIELGKAGDKLWLIWLAAAMFGSALTLASFMKLMHAAFLGTMDPYLEKKDIREVGFSMAAPVLILALLCTIFGIFAYAIPLRFFISPSVPGFISITGFWIPTVATALIIFGIIIGYLVYAAGKIKFAREDRTYIGGESLPASTRVSGVEFYDTIKDLGLLKGIYNKALGGAFDIYELGKRFASGFTAVLQQLHAGLLPMYLIWALLGLILLFAILLR